jgi:hypothetical protein
LLSLLLRVLGANTDQSVVSVAKDAVQNWTTKLVRNGFSIVFTHGIMVFTHGILFWRHEIKDDFWVKGCSILVTIHAIENGAVNQRAITHLVRAHNTPGPQA